MCLENNFQQVNKTSLQCQQTKHVPSNYKNVSFLLIMIQLTNVQKFTFIKFNQSKLTSRVMILNECIQLSRRPKDYVSREYTKSIFLITYSISVFLPSYFTLKCLRKLVESILISCLTLTCLYTSQTQVILMLVILILHWEYFRLVLLNQ